MTDVIDNPPLDRAVRKVARATTGAIIGLGYMYWAHVLYTKVQNRRNARKVFPGAVR